ncbi:MAG TPA: flagellar assembly protein FliW [Candidatus Didemnitutus sp.]|nr:flagellar assembly protein FliW [Candidatus Didemnitutus sp.]
MKVLPDLKPADTESAQANVFTLPHGLIGFENYTRAELLYLPDHLPFLWLKLHGPSDMVQFIVLEPGSLIANYEPELFDEDAAGLGLADPSEAMVLNIVSLRNQNPLDATINLVGPIILNRRTRIGRQLVISNYSRYSAHHPLVDSSAAGAESPRSKRGAA